MRSRAHDDNATTANYGTTPAPVGAVIAGRYKIRSLLGVGGMGSVYEALQIELRKRVAIKLIAPEFACSPDVLARFRRESRAASRAESEHIVQVFDCGYDPHYGYFLVMELLRGEDLGALLERRTKLPVEEALDIAVQVARGLGKAHRAGVIHRDLKPGNIFLVPREEGPPLVKIVDFGISKVFEDTSGVLTEVTKQGHIIGTVQYMSPEQARGDAVDGRTDVWSLGCVLYEMLTGKTAVTAEETLEKTLFRLLYKGVRPIREVAPGLDPALADIVDRALAFDPAQRVGSARDFAVLLERARRSLASGSISLRTGEPLVIDVDDTIADRALSSAAPDPDTERDPIVPTLPDPRKLPSERPVVSDVEDHLDANDHYVRPSAIREARLRIAEQERASWRGPKPALAVAVASISLMAVVWLFRAFHAHEGVHEMAAHSPKPVDEAILVPPPVSESAAAESTSASASASAVAVPSPAADVPVTELLERARRALESDPRDAVKYAEEARKRGAGGAASYLLGAAYQTMGQSAAAKEFYRQCARSKAKEAEECAALVDSL